MTSGQWRVAAGSEWVARDPFGAVKPADAPGGDDSILDSGGGVALRAARNAYASFRLQVAGRGEYRLEAEMPGGVEVDLFRAWYHRVAEGEPAYCTDALIPVEAGATQRLPDPDNAVPGQTHQEYWLDLFVPGDAPAGPHRGRVVLAAGGERLELGVTLHVLEAAVPDEDVLVCDHNSYGCSWLPPMYPRLFAACGDADARSRATIDTLHHYYRCVREHRGLFSNLGVGHAGTFDRIYGPPLRGRGREKCLDDWTWFDRHYGPLLDGSAFGVPAAGAPRPRRPAEPLWGVYTPINPAWPADYLWWGRPGYQVEFTRCVRQFDRHFRDKNWTRTRPYFFFNHKKRYRWFEWDGDEPKHAKDDRYFLEMGRLLRGAVGDSPVPWVFRMDASWRMKDHFERLAGLVDFWVCGGFARWYPEQIARVAARGDVVWTYGGTPGIGEASAALLEAVLRAWARGLGGHCRWLTTAPGDDPWFACTGCETALLYPGERFGVAGPIPSARLKLQRNALQDLALIDARARRRGRLERVRAQLAEEAGVRLWSDPPPAARELPPDQWDSRNLAGSQDDRMAEHARLAPLWWVPIRLRALGQETPP